MKKKSSFLIVCIAIILASCNSANHAAKSAGSSPNVDAGSSADIDLSSIDPGRYDSTWWNRAPYRLVQTNLREIDATMDVDAYVQSMVDVLEADPQNTKAIINLILAITDDFATSSSDMNRAQQLLPRFQNDYEKNYYAGIIKERYGMAILNRKIAGGHLNAFDWLNEAMAFYEKAEALRPQGNDDAILRWNTCLRLITSRHLKPGDEEYVEPPLE